MLYALLGWLAPLAAFGLYSLVHFARPRRPIASPARLDPGPPAFFVEAASRRHPSSR